MTAEEILSKHSKECHETHGERLNYVLLAMHEHAEQQAVDFLESIRDYERECGDRICFDERTSVELYKQFLNRDK